MNSSLEETLLWQLKVSGLPEPEREFKFCDDRKWRADFAYPAHGLLIEVHGGIWTRGRHTRGSGFEIDCAKYTMAARLGYRIFHFTGDEIKSGQAVSLIEEELSEWSGKSTGAEQKNASTVGTCGPGTQVDI